MRERFVRFLGAAGSFGPDVDQLLEVLRLFGAAWVESLLVERNELCVELGIVLLNLAFILRIDVLELSLEV